MDDTFFLLACNHIPDFGPRRIAVCQKIWPHLGDMFRATQTELLAVGLPEHVAIAIKTFDFRQIDADLAWENSDPNHHILAWGTPVYPQLLAEIDAPPPILYAKGSLACFGQRTLGMVGTRKPSAMGAETAWRFAHELAQGAQLTIVSGLALGIDAQAHQGCLAAGGMTVAVMGTGINVIYPRRHHSLAQQIMERGVLLSEFPLHSPPLAAHFPRRNRIISGLSSALLVVEAALRSGSLITARFAMEQNRDVFAIPGSIYHSLAMGCHRLVQQGACLVTSPQEVCDEMSLTGYQTIKNLSISSEICENSKLLRHIGFELTTIDQIIDRSGFSVDDVLCNVVELELQGWIQMIPGGYMRCR